MRKPLAVSPQCRQAAGSVASLSLLTFILFTNLAVVTMFLQSWAWRPGRPGTMSHSSPTAWGQRHSQPPGSPSCHRMAGS